jgi:hypothetical protein
MRRAAVVAFLVGLAWFDQTRACPAPAAQSFVATKDIFAYHAELLARDQGLKLEPPVAGDAELLVELIGLPNAPKINELCLQLRRTLGFRNALSFENGGYRTTVYDPDWAAFDTPAFYLALGHEVGHHFCGHTVGASQAPQSQKELEADEFAGASIKRLEIYQNRHLFSQVLAAASAKYPEQDPILGLSRASRLAAIERGYVSGSACGSLAPVNESGFVPAQRATGTARPCRPVRTGPTSYACEH